MNKDKIKKLLQDKLEPPFWDSDLDIIHEVYVNEIKEMIEKKNGPNGENLPFENSPEIYGNQRIESYKKGYNQALDDIITNITIKKSNMEKIKCKRCGSMATKGEYEDGVIDYFCKKCDITFFDNEEQTIIS